MVHCKIHSIIRNFSKRFNITFHLKPIRIPSAAIFTRTFNSTFFSQVTPTQVNSNHQKYFYHHLSNPLSIPDQSWIKSKSYLQAITDLSYSNNKNKRSEQVDKKHQRPLYSKWPWMHVRNFFFKLHHPIANKIQIIQRPWFSNQFNPTQSVFSAY